PPPEPQPPRQRDISERSVGERLSRARRGALVGLGHGRANPTTARDAAFAGCRAAVTTLTVERLLPPAAPSLVSRIAATYLPGSMRTTLSVAGRRLAAAAAWLAFGTLGLAACDDDCDPRDPYCRCDPAD